MDGKAEALPSWFYQGRVSGDIFEKNSSNENWRNCPISSSITILVLSPASDEIFCENWEVDASSSCEINSARDLSNDLSTLSPRYEKACNAYSRVIWQERESLLTQISFFSGRGS